MKPKLTPWFPGEMKPARPGIYQRNTWGNRKNPTYSLWDGKRWSFSSRLPETATRYAEQASSMQDKSWRGLASKP